MKKNKSQRRTYRQWTKAEDLVKTRIVIEETDLLIFSQTTLDKGFIKNRIFDLRQDIKNYIIKHQRFAHSLKPVAVELNTPLIVELMARAAKAANVGPMAAVAGGIAQVLAQSLTDKGYRQIIIENGGDLYLSRQKRKRVIGVFAGSSKFSRRIALEIKPSQTPCGICASSASFGHSLSFGEADCAVILAKDAALADAAATAVCNLIKSTDNFKHGIEFSKKIPGIFGVLIVLGNSLASWGDIQIKKLN